MTGAVATINDFAEWFVDEFDSLPFRDRRKIENATPLMLTLGKTGTLFPATLSVVGDKHLHTVEAVDALSDILVALPRRKRRYIVLLLTGGRFVRRKIADIRLPGSRACAMAEIDLAANTPFGKEDVHVVLPRDNGSSDGTSYFIIRKDEIDPIAHHLKQNGCTVGSIVFQTDDAEFEAGRSSLVALAGRSLSQRIKRWLKTACAITFLAGAIGTWAIADHRYDRAEQTLNAEIQIAQKAAGKARRDFEAKMTLLETISSLRREKNASGATVLMLEMLSDILPDNSWLSDITIEDGTIVLTGFSTSAEAIVPLLESSGRFADPKFSTPVNKVPGQDFERFTLKTRFVPQGPEA
ncbi:PilN domain-containing protein [Hoeflea poritis]|uniref:PilN domain-containing protein n=1 Tax=Hoeflea poritis TaxID=2993659 RepID=A0ABT4VXW1_9HYPH|nr:PilN domain-containing protein [Hoeflea poritis]MDA4848843.1 PilN domain-containing protein [Hoeflea poritis]